MYSVLHVQERNTILFFDLLFIAISGGIAGEFADMPSPTFISNSILFEIPFETK